MLRAFITTALCCFALGCVAFPVESSPSSNCGRRTGLCRKHLVVGFFPAIGEAHLNDLATNGEPLTAGLRMADYTLRPLYIVAINFLSLGFPTLSNWLLEPYEPYATDPGRCDKSLLGYCKAGKRAPREDKPPPSDEGVDRS